MQEENISPGVSVQDQPFPTPELIKQVFPPSEPEPDDPPWNAPVAFGTWVISLLLLILIGNIGVVIYALNQNISREDLPNFLEDPTVILIAIASVIPAHILTLVFCWFVVTKNGRYSFTKTLGFKWGNFHPGFSLLAVVAFYLLFGTLTYYFGDEDHQLMKILRSSRAAVYIVAFLATFTAPVVEETVYRGIIYSAFQRTFGIPAAVIITSLLFASVHFLQYSTSAVAIIMICVLSVGLTLIRVKSGNLLPCIVTHMIFNGLQAVGLLLEPYFTKPTIVPEPVQGLLIRLIS